MQEKTLDMNPRKTALGQFSNQVAIEMHYGGGHLVASVQGPWSEPTKTGPAG